MGRRGSDRYVEDSLCDLEADPYEPNYLVGSVSHRDIAVTLLARLVRHMVEDGEPAPVIEPAPTMLGGELLVLPEEVALLRMRQAGWHERVTAGAGSGAAGVFRQGDA